MVYFYGRYKAIFNSQMCNSFYKNLYMLHGLKLNIPYDKDIAD